jgi:outer membrane protein assembly factor BamB
MESARSTNLNLAAAAAIFVAAFTSRASEDREPGASWPMFRGNPALTGVAVGALPDKLSLLWSFKTGGPVKSSAAIVDGRVFIGSGDSNVFALELSSGKKNWAAKTGGPVDSSPLVLDGKVFFGSTDNSLYAVDAATGKQLWKYETGDKILGAPNWVKSPKGDANWVLVGSYDFKLHCLDAATGRTNWVYETGNYINGSPAVLEGKTGFGGCDGLLHLISLADGQQVKEVEVGAPIAGSAAFAVSAFRPGEGRADGLGCQRRAARR